MDLFDLCQAPIGATDLVVSRVVRDPQLVGVVGTRLTGNMTIIRRVVLLREAEMTLCLLDEGGRLSREDARRRLPFAAE